MKAWALDFRSRELAEVAAGELAGAHASEHFCWLDVAESDGFLAALPEQEADLPEDFTTGVVRDLEFADGWLAFGLVEPRVVGDRGGPVGLNVLFSAERLVTVDFGGSETLAGVGAPGRSALVAIAQRCDTSGSDPLLEEQVTDLQSRLFGDADEGVFAETASLVQHLGEFRHRLIIGHEIFDEMATRASAFVPETTRPFLARNADRVERTANELLLQRDALHSALDLCIGMNGHRTGQLLKRLTAFSIIFLPLSFLAGVFGMNFTHFPGLDAEWGFAAFCAVTVGITVALLAIAKRARWF